MSRIDDTDEFGPITSEDLEIACTLFRKDISWIERKMLKLAEEGKSFLTWQDRRDEERLAMRHFEEELEYRKEMLRG